MFGYFFLSLNFRHSSLIIHHSKIPCLFGTITHFPLLNIFHTIYGPYACHSVQLFLFLFFSSVPKLTEPSEKKKKHPKHEDRTSERRRKKKEETQNKPNQGKKKKKKKKKKPRTDRTSERRKKKRTE